MDIDMLTRSHRLTASRRWIWTSLSQGVGVLQVPIMPCSSKGAIMEHHTRYWPRLQDSALFGFSLLARIVDASLM
jgi:hypothetical protein